MCTPCCFVHFTVKTWDYRASTFQTASLSLPGKVYTMAVHGDKIVIGCSGRQVLVYDARDLSRPVQVRESSLKYQTRCIKLMPDGTGMQYQ
jgi:cell cycle arrest protein BUB3